MSSLNNFKLYVDSLCQNTDLLNFGTITDYVFNDEFNDENNNVISCFQDLDKYLQTHEITDTDLNFYCETVFRTRGVAHYLGGSDKSLINGKKALLFICFFVERGYVVSLPSAFCPLYNKWHNFFSNDDDVFLLSWTAVVEQSLAKRKNILCRELGALFIPPLYDLVMSCLKKPEFC